MGKFIQGLGQSGQGSSGSQAQQPVNLMQPPPIAMGPGQNGVQPQQGPALTPWPKLNPGMGGGQGSPMTASQAVGVGSGTISQLLQGGPGSVANYLSAYNTDMAGNGAPSTQALRARQGGS